MAEESTGEVSGEPEPRCWAQCEVIEDKLFLYRGFLQSYQGKYRANFPTHFEVFEGKRLAWEEVATRGTNPRVLVGMAMTSISHKLYLYGGEDSSTPTNQLFKVDTQSMLWAELIPCNPSDGPMRKLDCGLVSLPGDVLCVFGGYGIPAESLQPGSRFIQDQNYTDGRGWTNEIHCYRVRSGVCTFKIE